MNNINNKKMKPITYFMLATALICGLASCKKDTAISLSPLASINVTNVVVGGATLTLNTSALTIANNNYAQLALNAGNSLVDLYPAATPSSPYYNQTVQTNSGDYYSLFLSGTSPSFVDNVLIHENYQNYTDSLCGVRFINLSPGSNPISVNVNGAVNGSTVASLAYKAYSNFVQFPAKKTNTTYAFQVRDAATGTLLLSYTLSTPFFHNVTLVFRGLPGAQAILLDKDY